MASEGSSSPASAATMPRTPHTRRPMSMVCERMPMPGVRRDRTSACTNSPSLIHPLVRQSWRIAETVALPPPKEVSPIRAKARKGSIQGRSEARCAGRS
jgi:hypothetical protein